MGYLYKKLNRGLNYTSELVSDTTSTLYDYSGVSSLYKFSLSRLGFTEEDVETATAATREQLKGKTKEELMERLIQVETELNMVKSTGALPAWEELRPAVPVDAKKTSNEENVAAFNSGELKHFPPHIEYFDPEAIEGRTVHIKEIKLPRADQTHEICFEPETQCVFVTQMSNSVLVRIPIDGNGYLVDDQDAWMIGPTDEKGEGLCGMHNVSLSTKHPGCLWISLQYSNQLMLLDVKPPNCMKVKQLINVPTWYDEPTGGRRHCVGGPHCIREDPQTGDIWVALKGALRGSPCGFHKSACCDADKMEVNMSKLKEQGFDTTIPDGWAVWQLSPDKYDPNAEDGAHGGRLYPCFKSPPMITFDAKGNVYSPQDGKDTMLYIDATTHVSEQLNVPFPADIPQHLRGYPRITGPAIATDPNGTVWMSLLGSYNALVRIDPERRDKPALYEFGGPPWASKLRLIHLAFSPAGNNDFHNRIYALASDLLDDEAINAVLVFRMDEEWRKCLGRRIIPLPTQDCACHRIAFVDADITGRPQRSRSVVITELASSKVLQIKVRNLLHLAELDEEISTSSQGFEVRKYTAKEDQPGLSV
mmetsp:Transcript_64808/g.128113  ORF Transcript_64808/g.128113 Transcript_64808/m.128113 type:complete len:591 (-) Transcript_64808:189-1961(-)|eukprot:CAMPEP_0174694914 /NCGR_PEP_ID=MMETSP1094-20130205/1394_1 /TAXON_ID=156173 /ORGANISM="Chrysochromulina brevifilum, Strain UTEX LB 985" /LENGTH=590 /DNA_ID=CAMNT_0015891277 /DNA_START=84 /DNA_END=1856 /DNA_ORIENTATION=-